jgi:hypothetical protein
VDYRMLSEILWRGAWRSSDQRLNGYSQLHSLSRWKIQSEA